MKWRDYAARELPRVIRKLGIPCARQSHATGMTRCPRHDQPLGRTRMCLACHTEAWDEVGRRYAAQGQPAEPERRVSTFPGSNRKPLPGQLPLFDTAPKEETMGTTTSTELAEHELLPAVIDEPPAPPITLFGTSDPKVALERMADVATALVDVIEQKRLFANNSGRRHITVEGWTCLGGMLGVHAIVTETRLNDAGDGIVAHVEARTLDGRVVGAADGECSRAERNWKTRDPHALRAMAQTRGISRALRAPLGQIVVLAGYQAAGAEEIIDVVDTKPEPDTAGPTRKRDSIPDAIKPTGDQVAELKRLLTELATAQPEVDWKRRARDIAGVPGDMLNRTAAEILLGKLDQQLEELFR